MNEFVEKNRPLLRSYCIITRIIGWLLLISSLVIAVIKTFSDFNADDQFRFLMIYRLCQRIVVSYVLLALILLSLAQFVRYLYENESRPGLILRHGDKVLYLYALALIVNPILYNYLYMNATGYPDPVNLFYLLISILPSVAMGLIFIGMAKVLKRMMPMVEESKTLV